MKRNYFDPNDPNSFVCVETNPAVLDFTGCKYLGEIHQILKNGLGLPDYYGENWDALWDCISFYLSYPISIEIYGLSTLPADLRRAVEPMLEIFQDAHNESSNVAFSVIS